MEVCQSHRSFWSPTFASVGFTSQSSRNALQMLQILLVDCRQQDSATETVQVVSSKPRWTSILRRPCMTWKITSKRTLSLVKRPIVGHLTCSSRSIRSACCKTTFPFNTWCELGFKDILVIFQLDLLMMHSGKELGRLGEAYPAPLQGNARRSKGWLFGKDPRCQRCFAELSVSEGFAKRKVRKCQTLLNFARHVFCQK